MNYAPAYPHDPIEQILPDVYLARGSIRMNPLMRISRNMTIVRHGNELTLINAMRLDQDGEAALRMLGNVSRILRVGPMHGLDDSYYKDKFGAEIWAPGTSDAYAEPEVDVFVEESTPLPIPHASLFCFQGTAQAEAALLLSRDGGLLVTCDSIQHYGDYRHNTWLARRVMPLIGFPRTTVVGPIWLKLMTPQGGSLAGEFERLLGLQFRHLVAGHGSFLRDEAHAGVRAAVERAFPQILGKTAEA